MKYIILFLALATALRAVILPSTRVADWTVAGVDGGIPTRTTISQTVNASTYGNDSTAALTEIQNKINATASGQVCYIPPGRYRVSGAISVPSNITVRGAGPYTLSTSSVAVGTGTKTFTVPASLGYVSGTVIRVVRVISGLNFDSGTYMQGSVTSYSGTTLTLNVTSSADGGGSGTYSNWRVDLTVIVASSTSADIFAMGSYGGGMQYDPTSYSTVITSGSTQGSTSFVVTSATGITTGSLLVVTELNNAEVSLTGFANTPSQATWVDGWNDSGARARGQIVEVTNVSGTTITFTPALYVDYTSTPWATRYLAIQCQNSGIEDLGVYSAGGASTSGTNCNFRMDSAMNCWLYGIYSDFASGDHVEIDWSYRCEVRKCFFEDAFIHTSGTIDTQVGLRLKSTNCLVIDNIMKRLHISSVLEWGVAGNVRAYNYMFGEYDQSFSSGTRALQMSMNANHGAFPQFNLDEGNITQHYIPDSFWGSSGDNTTLRNWMTGIGQGWSPYDARGTPGTPYALTQGQYAFDIYEGQYRINAIGNIIGDSSSTGGTYSATDPGSRTYTTRYMRSLGYGNSAGSGDQSILPNPNVDMIYHGNYDYVNQAIVWDAGIADHVIPNSYFLSSKPSFFGSLTWPVFDVSSPSPTVSSIPAGYRYINGIDPPAGGPSLVSVTVGTNGTTTTVVFDQAATRGAGWNNGDMDLDGTVTNNALTYVSGDGTTTWTMTAASTVNIGETVNFDFNGDANSVENGAGDDMAAVSNAPVTNNSTQGAATISSSISGKATMSGKVTIK